MIPYVCTKCTRSLKMVREGGYHIAFDLPGSRPGEMTIHSPDHVVTVGDIWECDGCGAEIAIARCPKSKN